MTEGKVHHMTLKRMVRDGELTQTLADDVRRGEETIENALALMHERSENSGHYDSEGNVRTDEPPKPESRNSKDDRTQECWCGCGERTKRGRRWLPGHDQRAKGIIKRAVREGKADELPDRLREYADERNLIEETRQQMEREEQRKREKSQEKADKQRRKEGEAADS